MIASFLLNVLAAEVMSPELAKKMLLYISPFRRWFLVDQIEKLRFISESKTWMNASTYLNAERAIFHWYIE